MAAYAKQKEQEDERQVVRTSERSLVPAAEANVPAAVATYGAHKPDDAAVDRRVSHLNNECVFFADPRQDQIRRRSRRREDDPDAEITYINEKNKHFNKKIKRVRATTDAVL